MSKVLGADQSGYRDFQPEYEIPVERRQILRVSEETNRGVGNNDTADFNRPLRFIWTNPNPMTVVRSAFYRLPLKIEFKDQRGLVPSSRSAAKMALRNRQSKMFRDQRLIINGMAFHHDAELDAIEEYTNRWSGPGAFQLQNQGLPVTTVREYENTMDQTRFNALTTQVLGSASVPHTQTQVSTHAPTQNENFAERSKMFQADYDNTTGVWQGEVCVPLQGGVFQPYKAKKSVGSNKYIPFISQLHVEANFETGSGRTDRPTTNPDHYGVAQGLFERSSNVADACRDTFEAGPEYELRPYTLVANADYAWMNIELDTQHQNVGTNLLPRGQTRSLETATDLSGGAAARLQKVLEVFKPGTGIRFSPELATYSHVTEETLAQRAVIGNVTSFASFTGQFAGLHRDEINMSCHGLVNNAQAIARYNPLEVTPGGTYRAAGSEVNLFVRCASSIEGMAGQHNAIGQDISASVSAAHGGATAQNIRRGQLESLRNPSVGVSISGFSLSAAEVQLLTAAGAADVNKLRYPFVRYFVESRDSVPTHWNLHYDNHAVNQAADQAYFAQKTILANQGVNTPVPGYVGQGNAAGRALVNEYLMSHGYHYRINIHGFPALAGDLETPAGHDALQHEIVNGVAVGNVNYTWAEMYHIGVSHAAMGVTTTAPHYPLSGDAVLAAGGSAGRGISVTGRYKFRLFPTRFDTAHDKFRPDEYSMSVREGIGSVSCQFTGQPVLELELIDFSRSVRMRPVQQLWCPQKEIYYQADLAQGGGAGEGPNNIQFTRVAEVTVGQTNEKVILMNNIRLNEVFNTITIVGRLAERSKARFEYVEYLKPYIKSLEIGIAENPKLTTQYSSQLLYRMFRENTLSEMTYADWRNNCIICLSPQQLAIPNFSESLSIVSAINLKITLEPSPIAKNLLLNWDHLNYAGSTGTVMHNQPADNNALALAPSEPYYELRVYFDYSLRSLLMNSRREVLLKKNARVFKGNSGLRLDRTGLPEQRGLKLY